MSDIVKICQRTVEYSFYLLFFLVPLIMTPWNYELFEFNKMLLVYLLTIIIVGAWLVKMILQRKIIFKRTFFDIPLLIFLISQFLSFLFSIDRHTSFWGYYSRFHGGLASTIAYLLLYWAFVSNLDSINKSREVALASESVPKSRRQAGSKKILALMSRQDATSDFITNCLAFLLGAACLVTSYGILEHFGIDAQYWVQDVRNRVFSTLGQPNWLAAWLVALLPMPMALAIGETKNGKRKTEKNVLRITYYLLPAIFYTCLLFTKSRSGLLGFAFAFVCFWGLTSWLHRRKIKDILKPFLVFTSSSLLLALAIGTPWTPNAHGIYKKFVSSPKASSSAQPSQLEANPLLKEAANTGYGTESGEIRKIVWKGAIEIWKHHPLLGTGPETFAYSYYWYRPREHNDVSEWDFLYNKAHNEYLNYLATTGIIGLSGYALVIAAFLLWNLKRISNFQFPISKQTSNRKSQKELGQLEIRSIRNLRLALLSGYVSILVTNFFGFSVVPVVLLFFLYPALALALVPHAVRQRRASPKARPEQPGWPQWVGIILILFLTLYSLLFILRYWYADTLFARGEKLNKAGRYQEALATLQKATKIYSSEPNYRNELGLAAANLAVSLYQQSDSKTPNQLAEMAVAESNKALEISPYHLNFWKNRIRILYRLSEIDPQYNEPTLQALLRAAELAPTDAKIHYNLALMFARVGKDKLAVETMEKTIQLKPNYDSAYYALALFYEKEGKIKEARELLEYVLSNINPSHKPSKEKLEELLPTPR